jgi:hypothetical protein
MSALFIILTLILIFGVVIYIISTRRGDSGQVITETKDIPAEDADDEEDV